MLFQLSQGGFNSFKADSTMNQQHTQRRTFRRQQVRPLLALGLWLGILGSLIPGPIKVAVAEDLLISPDAAPEAASPNEPFLEDLEPLAAPAPLDPAPAPDVYGETAPLPLEPAPYSEAPIAAPESPAPPLPTVVDEPYIDTQDYSVGATEPYAPPETVVVNERGSGCQAVLAAGQAIAASLCGPPPAQQLYAAPPEPTQAPPAWAERWASRGIEPTWQAVSAGPSPSNNAASIRNTLKSFTVAPPPRMSLKPLTGANPLKWVMPNGERMIFPLPVPVDITSVFGWRTHPITGRLRFHSGIDLAAETGTPVLAAFSGKVTLADLLGGYGLLVLLEHNEGQQETRYGHLSEIFVKPGQWVPQGTVIGLVGSTGQSTGPHLHFETLQATPSGMVAVDPQQDLQLALTRLAQALQTARLTAAEISATVATETPESTAQSTVQPTSTPRSDG